MKVLTLVLFWYQETRLSANGNHSHPRGMTSVRPGVPAGEVKKMDAQNSAGEEDVLLSKSPSSLSANISSSPKGEEA